MKKVIQVAKDYPVFEVSFQEPKTSMKYIHDGRPIIYNLSTNVSMSIFQRIVLRSTQEDSITLLMKILTKFQGTWLSCQIQTFKNQYVNEENSQQSCFETFLIYLIKNRKLRSALVNQLFEEVQMRKINADFQERNIVPFLIQ